MGVTYQKMERDLTLRNMAEETRKSYDKFRGNPAGKPVAAPAEQSEPASEEPAPQEPP